MPPLPHWCATTLTLETQLAPRVECWSASEGDDCTNAPVVTCATTRQPPGFLAEHRGCISRKKCWISLIHQRTTHAALRRIDTGRYRPHPPPVERSISSL